MTITVKNQVAAALLCALLLSVVYAKAQERFEAGPYKGFLKENPELNKIKLPEPFRVSEVKGNITYSGARPLSGAVFEIRDRNGRVFSATTDATGNFSIPLIPMGTYALKVTKNEFHSVVGTVVVSKNILRTKSIKIQLRLGT